MFIYWTQVYGCKAREHFRSNIDVNSSLKMHSNSRCIFVAFCRFTILKCHFCWSDSSSFLNSFSDYKMFVRAGWLALNRDSVCSLIYDLFGFGDPAIVALRVTQMQISSRWCVISKNVWMMSVVMSCASVHTWNVLEKSCILNCEVCVK